VVGKSPRVGVVIVDYNDDDLLEKAVRSACEQSYRPHRIFVVDNASSDGSGGRAKRACPQVELLRLDENVGFAAGNNIGIERLDDCELIALLNPDAVAERDWLEHLVAAASEHPEHASFASTIVRADEPGRLDSAGDVYHVYGTAWPGRRGLPASPAPGPGEVFGGSGAAVLYRRDWLLHVGGFDERYFCYFEDVDLNLRLQVAGGRCLFVPEARVHHVGGVSSDGSRDFVLYHSHRNLVWTFVKSAPPHIFWRYLPMHLLLNVASVVSFSAHGEARPLLRAKRDALLGLPAMMRSRRRVMRTRAYERETFDRVMRFGPRALLRETRV
jgi:GT2 family glycosyltransferase